MSSFGGQWRVIRHYLSMTNLNAEVEKLVQKIKPATPEQWENLIKKFEKAISARYSTGAKEIEASKLTEEEKLKATTVEEEISKTEEKEVEKVPEKLPEKQSAPIGAETKEITFETLLRGLKLKTDLHFGKISEPQWKDNKPIVSKTSIHSRTAYVISAIVTAETPESLRKRSEQFVDHLLQYPESRDYAIKEGGIRALLRAQHRLRGGETLEKEVAGIIKEALALLGYSGPTIGPGPNILSIDGGGIRGIIAVEILRQLEALTGRRVHQMFDMIVGVSTGAIIAAVIGAGVGNLDTASEMYNTLSKKMFGNTSIIGGTSRLVWSQSYYDTEAWEKMLQDHLGDITLSQCNRFNAPKMALVSSAVRGGSHGRLSPFVYRTYSGGYRVRAALPGTCDAKVWEAVRASAAAPTYFHEFSDKHATHQDGGIVANNPTGIGIHEARVVFGQNLQKGCIVSIGTGQPLREHNVQTEPTNTTSWRDKFNVILDSATDTEGTHLLLNCLLPNGSYFRFNPPLHAPVAMDEIDQTKLQLLRQDAAAYVRRNRHKFQEAAAVLTRKRSVAQKVVDFVEYQSQIMGVAYTK